MTALSWPSSPRLYRQDFGNLFGHLFGQKWAMCVCPLCGPFSYVFSCVLFGVFLRRFRFWCVFLCVFLCFLRAARGRAGCLASERSQDHATYISVNAINAFILLPSCCCCSMGRRARARWAICHRDATMLPLPRCRAACCAAAVVDHSGLHTSGD